MGKHSAFHEIERALLQAIMQDNEAIELSSLDNLTQASEILKEAKLQLEFLHRASRSVEINIRYHQGRAMSIDAGCESGLTAYERRTAQNAYQLFKRHDFLIPHCYGRTTDIFKLTSDNIRQLRSYLEDPINDELDEICDFKGFEDEPLFEGDVM